MGKRDESESTFNLGEGSLRVNADYGEYTVRPADDDTVRVRIEKSGSLLSSLSTVDVSARRDGDTVIIQSTTNDVDLVDGPDVTVDVEIPPGVRVESAAVGTGGVLIEDVRVHPGARIHADNGGAVTRRVDGDLEVTAGNGGAVAEHVAGFVTARSNNGAAAVYGCDGIDGAATSNGGVEVDVTALRSDTELTTTNGGIEAALPSDLDAHIVASTEHGGVDVTDVPFSPSRSTESYVEGTIGEGTHTLRIETTNGGITLSGPKDW